MELLLQDIRYAVRTLVKSPLFTAVAALTIALGIGANTAIFSIVNGVLLRPLPYERPGELTMIWNRWEGWPQTWVSEDELWDLRHMNRAFTGVAAFTDGGRNLTGGDTPERVRTGFAMADVFGVLGARPLLGRTYTADEDRPGGTRVAVIGEGLWRRRFAGDPSIIGRAIFLDDSSTTVIGVMPASFQLPLHFDGQPMDLWLPLRLDSTNTSGRGSHYLNVVGRMRPGITATAADRDVAAVARRMKEQFPNNYSPGFGALAVGVEQQVLGDVRTALFIMLGAVGLVLLVACANVANLLLARAESRQREIAVRTALGAGRVRLVRQMLTESVVLFLAGGGLGIALAAVGLRVLVAAAPPDIPRVGQVGIDATVLGFTVGLSLLTGIVFGLVPALHAVRGALHTSLKEGRGTSSDRASQRSRSALVVAEVALALVLVVGAALLMKSFARLRGVDPGFDPKGVVTMRLTLPPARYVSSAMTRRFYRTLIDRVRALPGVESAAAVRVLPLTSTMGDWSFAIEGRTAEPGVNYAGDWQVATADYFKVMRIPLRRGRLTTDADDERGTPVVVIGEALAKAAWPQGDALGARITLGPGDSVYRTVIGIVGDVRHRGLDADARPEMYLPHAQFPGSSRGGIAQRNMVLVARTRGDPAALSGAIRRELAAVDPTLPVSAVQTMEEVLGTWAAERRLTAGLLGGFGLVALTLAALGIYGVMAYAVAQRTRELGIRVALGAQPGDVVSFVVGQAMRVAAGGIVVGLAGAFALTRLMRGMLFHVSPTDPVTFTTIPIVLAIVALAAAAIPARRATRVDPAVTLKTD
jgi:putative ABC transport system permease protein